MYMNADKGLTPDYGMGQFWNTYNIYVPLDTYALAGALLAWGHTYEVLQYTGYFFDTFVNNVTGAIDYGNFGCDNDANYGRLIDLFVTAVEYSEDVAWARAHLPTVHAMAVNVLKKRDAAVAAYPPASPLYGIVPGTPDHDICKHPGYYFASNVWFVRGLLSLHRLHVEYPSSLAMNATIEAALLPTTTAWRTDINTAAKFTAVKRADGNGLYFLTPVVGSVYAMPPNPVLLPGGFSTDCFERGTCFASMTASIKGNEHGSNQSTN
jgi:hypothetical protein